VNRVLRELLRRFRRTVVRHELWAYNPELAGPILIRYSEAGDQAVLERLAVLDGRKLPESSFLLAEIDGELVAAAPIDVDVEPMSDPFRPTASLRELLSPQARQVRRHRETVRRPARAAPRALRDTP